MTGAGAIGAVRGLVEGADSAQAALGALGALVGSGLTAPLLDALVEDAPSPETAARAAFSYRHALGFEKLMLLVGEPHYMLRAHIWPRTGPTAEPGTTEHIHNHRFGFASAVLLGDLGMRLYEPDPAGEVFAAHEERITTGEWLIRPRGPARLRLRADLRLARGTRYCLEAEARHRIVRNPDVRTVTLFLETATERAHTDVYTAVGTPVPPTAPKRPLDRADYVEALRSLRSLLG
ncbi:hypothetical protein ACEZDB_16965 [Streptacidiphilus sp. N1-3]|uniref:Uncharacterized protein n=1 Tax=Streptacidiphilus alkalitolerans TaxID=3342712 RepID=A0ABV6X2C2_9ACTN